MQDAIHSAQEKLSRQRAKVETKSQANQTFGKTFGLSSGPQPSVFGTYELSDLETFAAMSKNEKAIVGGRQFILRDFLSRSSEFP